VSTDGEGKAPMCGERRYLPADLVQQALRFESPKKQRGADSVERALRCTLQDHGPDLHHALVLELDRAESGAVWARWSGEGRLELVRLPDCPGEDESACNEYVDHPGGHSFQVHDPWGAWQDRLPLPPA
jgi:hypothetical protein